MATGASSVAENMVESSKVTIVKPDHVTLGQCVVHQEFVRKYSSLQDVEIVNLLRDGYKYDGFKDILIESAEGEGFANMHHILLLSSLDSVITKELCVQRGNNINFDISKLKDNCAALTDINSAVIMIPNKLVDFYYFGKKEHSHFQLDYPEDDFKAALVSDILTLEFSTHLIIINFGSNPPEIKHVDSEASTVLATGIEMVVTCSKSENCPIISCDYMHSKSVDSILVSRDSFTDISSGKLLTVYVGKHFWISANDSKLSAYELVDHKELVIRYEIDIKSFFPSADNLIFVDLIYCCTTKKAFVLYLKETKEDVSSFILIFDVTNLEVNKILEMELTLNRRPQFVMYPLRDGSKLFVQEMFENRVIFYQAFTLLPVDLELKKLLL